MRVTQLEVGILYMIQNFYDSPEPEFFVLVLDKYPLTGTENGLENIPVPEGETKQAYLDFIFTVAEEDFSEETEQSLLDITPNKNLNSIHLAKALLEVSVEEEDPEENTDLLDRLNDVDIVSLTYVREVSNDWVKDTRS